MAFTADATTDRGKCRILVGDTNSGDYTFEDADVDAMLELNSDSVWLASADLCRSQSARNASNAFILDIAGSIMIDKKQVAKVWLTLAHRYEARAVTGPDSIIEYVDSYDTMINELGQDVGEYVGDLY